MGRENLIPWQIVRKEQSSTSVSLQVVVSESQCAIMATLTQTNTRARVEYFPFQLEKNSMDLEQQYQLGGTDDIEADDDEDFFSSPEGRIKLTNIIALVCVYVCRERLCVRV